MKSCINDKNYIKFEIQNYGQILCVHKPYFLMPGHILYITTNYMIIMNV